MSILKLKNINKTYVTSGNTLEALKDVSLEFRTNEFVSVLGPSGCGKTTLLNIIGGLDQYTKGDLIINGKSTKEYKDRDWDAYRNHSIGFVFQSYNLIPHQSAVSNVELALTLSGVSKEKRRQKAIEVLKKVGLEDHMYKRPNQMSGGQMQRIAIARALINDPDILLADEPTGALDSETSIQVMDLLKEIAKDKLVIMVTHNPELAQKYSTRIIRFLDGNVIGDTDPYNQAMQKITTDQESKKSKHSMSFITALSLSLNNLMTKKGRTFLTAFAGSIGIIGIALILSLSTGVQNYIQKVQEDTLSSYPVTIEQSSVDITSLIGSISNAHNNNDREKEENRVYSKNVMGNMMNAMTAQIETNNLEAFKAYLESDATNINDYVNDIQYSYNLDLQIYKTDTSDKTIQVNPNTVFDTLGMQTGGPMGFSSSANNSDVWKEMLNNQELLESQYNLLSGKWPVNYNEVVIIVDQKDEITDFALYSLGLKDQSELENVRDKILAGEEFEVEDISYSYEQLLDLSFSLVLNTDYFQKENDLWIDKSEDNEFMKQLIANGEKIEVVGIIQLKDDALISGGSEVIGYTKKLTDYVIEQINNSQIAKEQLDNPNTNVFTGMEFQTDNNASFDISSLSLEQQAYLASLSPEELATIMATYAQNANATFENNLLTLGVVDIDNPSTINIYAKDFDSKEAVTDIIDQYNTMRNEVGEEEYVINYSDIMGLLLSSVTSIVNIISYVLIAFVSISLVVSSIMIGIITYISVLERTKEIGILRAIGASKKDISRVFNAETLIVGFVAGAIGIVTTIILNIPASIIIKNMTDVDNIATLPIGGAIVLIAISMLLTVIAGLFPARVASKKDPVEALRTE